MAGGDLYPVVLPAPPKEGTAALGAPPLYPVIQTSILSAGRFNTEVEVCSQGTKHAVDIPRRCSLVPARAPASGAEEGSGNMHPSGSAEGTSELAVPSSLS